MKTHVYLNKQDEEAFIAEVATALEMPKNTMHTKRILCGFFKTIRERIPPIASSVLIAHLPKSLKKVYTENWNNKFCPDFDYNEFIDALYSLKGMEHLRLFSSKEHVEKSVAAIFDVLKRQLSDNQYAAFMSLMPLLLRVNLMHDYVFEGHSYFM